jgi:hypothetical protein
MDSHWLIKRTVSKALPDGRFITVTAGLHHIDGNDRPYFSVTCDIWENGRKLTGVQRHRRGYESEGGGAAHEVILEAFPELAPVVLVHLADDCGAPMHAVENGWYFYSGRARHYEESRRQHYPADREPYNLPDIERAARALNVTVADIPAGLTRDTFAAFVESLRPRWAAQAAAAVALLESLPE